MTFNTQFLRAYIAQAPLALALERAYECAILAQQPWEGPVLDIGCGDGLFAAVLCHDKIDTGIDSNAQVLKAAEQRGVYKELICCTAAHIPKNNGTYKTIIANSVLEHIQPLEDVLREARRVLADDGTMFVTVPAQDYDRFTVIYQVLSACGLTAWAELSRRWFNRFWKHYHHGDCKTWESLFQKSGWKVAQNRAYSSKTQCMIHDQLVPLSLGSWVAQRLCHRWFFWPRLRHWYSGILVSFFEGIVEKDLRVTEGGGLIFFELKKA